MLVEMRLEIDVDVVGDRVVRLICGWARSDAEEGVDVDGINNEGNRSTGY